MHKWLLKDDKPWDNSQRVIRYTQKISEYRNILLSCIWFDSLLKPWLNGPINDGALAAKWGSFIDIYCSKLFRIIHRNIFAICEQNTGVPNLSAKSLRKRFIMWWHMQESQIFSAFSNHSKLSCDALKFRFLHLKKPVGSFFFNCWPCSWCFFRGFSMWRITWA